MLADVLNSVIHPSRIMRDEHLVDDAICDGVHEIARPIQIHFFFHLVVGDLSIHRDCYRCLMLPENCVGL